MTQLVLLPGLAADAAMGGMLAMETARQAPQRIRGLALLGTTARPESPQMRALREDAIALFVQARIATSHDTQTFPDTHSRS